MRGERAAFFAPAYLRVFSLLLPSTHPRRILTGDHCAGERRRAEERVARPALRSVDCRIAAQDPGRERQLSTFLAGHLPQAGYRCVAGCSAVWIMTLNWQRGSSLTSAETEATTPNPESAPRMRPLGNLTWSAAICFAEACREAEGEQRASTGWALSCSM
mgnify:CR=1 FL=1